MPDIIYCLPEYNIKAVVNNTHVLFILIFDRLMFDFEFRSKIICSWILDVSDRYTKSFLKTLVGVRERKKYLNRSKDICTTMMWYWNKRERHANLCLIWKCVATSASQIIRSHKTIWFYRAGLSDYYIAPQ